MSHRGQHTQGLHYRPVQWKVRPRAMSGQDQGWGQFAEEYGYFLRLQEKAETTPEGDAQAITFLSC